ncbi:DUF445 domain-containing protein [Neobacillus niacini]|uniref:DUF445 domain-containing protein n=1 Tax=Neobacillus niacini TaxID=86668 RepID=UPI00285DF4C9|nr:DUF445 domain-containing protein [Neobacillus niacini]MDR7001734.1 uncharacterized membrane-anchored protein YjiN (DUF445 family) [Neobacillus niacini]
MFTRKKKSQRLATISLLIMAVGFVATIPLQSSIWGTLLQGGFEAGLVGGLADWFAVTALFRHPLGIPIPHTAILPKNRERIIAAIISMLENDWLTKESIRKKVAVIPFMEKLIGIAERELETDSARKNIINGIHYLIDKVNVEKIAPLVEMELKLLINRLDMRVYLPVIIDEITKRKYDEKALDYILNEVDEWARKDTTKDRLGRMAAQAIENFKADGFMQFALKSFSNLVNEEKLGNIIQNLIQKGINSFRDPYNQNRVTLLISLNDKLQNMKSDEALITELNNVKEKLVTGWEPEEKIISFLQQFKQKAIDFIQDPAFFEGHLQPFINNSINDFKSDDEKIELAENWIKKQISIFVEKNHSKIGKLVEENLEKLDDKTLIHMIETNVGKDLQWIRVNGAVCGFLIGLVLVALRLLF